MRSNWTIGVITDGCNPERLQACIDSILPNLSRIDQLIIVGGEKEPEGICDAEFAWIPFNENIKKGWITKKKNLVADLATGENICLMHDYVSLVKGWRDGFDKHDTYWNSMTNVIRNADGTRFRDWCAIYNDAWMNPPIDDQKPPPNIDGHLLNYTNNTMGRWQYYSGAYFCVKRHVIKYIPLNEDRVWGQGEDVEWCRRLYKIHGQEAFSFNPISEVKFLKQKERAPWESFSPI